MAKGHVREGSNVGAVIIILVALLAILALYLYSKLEWVEKTVTIPPSLKVTSNRYYTAEQLLSKSGFQVKTIGDTLALGKLPQNATLVLFNVDLLKEPSQKLKLMKWVQAGGHLVLSPRSDEHSIELQELFDIYLDDECDDADDECQQELSETQAKKDRQDQDEVEQNRANSDRSNIVFEKDKMVAAMRETNRFYVDGQTIESVMASAKSDWEIISRFQFDKGFVTVVPLHLFTNANIKKYDHSKLWIHMATLPNRDDTVYLVRYVTFPNLMRWLVENAFYSLLAFGLCILLVLWRYIPRFGALIPTPPPIRPSLTEHLKAVSEFHLQNRDYIRLITPLREEVLRLLQPLRIHHPGSRSDAHLIEQITHYDMDLITQALEADIQQLNQFTQCAQTLCLLIDRLNSLQSSTSRRLNYGI
ncbi:DUF4350 domain-containing protein [Pragia fontium]|uniref:DUF4350 domain-containing protein n=2 Tax=Pragia fontium TaxID=82985 RepID=A0AAJ4W8L3_9GAMM|nr:DUF4350 domain-containing protein [Pragia fontium]GKX63268.1 hypothetical protein SOASR032_18370 [Pragia fontium]SFC15432.1 hypothetical protein SAMN02745723_101525 [Pragia fontium DSM 5563 = ATCC 49100]VEJ53422.1 Uncharacterised protein [Pragia fontium]